MAVFKLGRVSYNQSPRNENVSNTFKYLGILIIQLYCTLGALFTVGHKDKEKLKGNTLNALKCVVVNGFKLC